MINLIAKDNIQILQEWENTLKEHEKQEFKDLMAIRRIHLDNIENIIDTDNHDNMNNNPVNLGSIPRKIVKIIRKKDN